MLAGSLGDDVDDDDRQSMGFQMGNARLLSKPQNNYVWNTAFKYRLFRFHSCKQVPELTNFPYEEHA